MTVVSEARSVTKATFSSKECVNKAYILLYFCFLEELEGLVNVLDYLALFFSFVRYIGQNLDWPFSTEFSVYACSTT